MPPPLQVVVKLPPKRPPLFMRGIEESPDQAVCESTQARAHPWQSRGQGFKSPQLHREPPGRGGFVASEGFGDR